MLGTIGPITELDRFEYRVTTMSQYVEARYALLTLQEARETSEDRATDLLVGLLKDLAVTERDDRGRADVLASIEHLTLVLREHKMPPSSYWDAAYEAAHTWREHAYL